MFGIGKWTFWNGLLYPATQNIHNVISKPYYDQLQKYHMGS